MPSPFVVVYSETVRANLKLSLRRAIDNGSGEEAISALTAIDHFLQTDPHDFGDPLYDLPARTQKMMHRLFTPWFVVYGVHNQKDFVFVRSISLYPEI